MACVGQYLIDRSTDELLQICRHGNIPTTPYSNRRWEKPGDCYQKHTDIYLSWHHCSAMLNIVMPQYSVPLNIAPIGRLLPEL